MVLYGCKNNLHKLNVDNLMSLSFVFSLADLLVELYMCYYHSIIYDQDHILYCDYAT